MNRLMLNGNQLMTGDPTLKLDRPWTAHPSIQISCISNPGDLKWVYLALPLSMGDVIKAVTIYYQCSSKSSNIRDTRLAEQTFPNIATVLHDDPTVLDSTAPAYHTTAVKWVQVHGSIVLDLRLDFANTTDTISIGAIAIDF